MKSQAAAPPLLLWYPHAAPGAPLRRVLGLTLVKRAVLAAQKSGHQRVVVVCHEIDQSTVRAELAGDRRVAARLSIETPPTALPAALGRWDEGEQWVVVLGDRVWLPAAIAPLDVPLDDGTEMRIALGAGMARGRVAALGRLPDPGLLADPLATEQLHKSMPGCELLPSDSGWQAVEEAAEVRAAETLLLRSLGKAADGIISRNINRKISTSITRRLAPHRVSPNHVTTVVLAIGLASGPLAYLGSYLGLMLGAFCYYAAAVLDGVDGELARLKYQGSPFGTWYDTVVDDIVGLCFIVGLYAGLSRGVAHPYWAWIGIGTVTCYLATIVPRYYLLVTRVGDGNHQTLAAQTASNPVGPFGRVMQVLKETVARTDFLPFYAFVAALCAAAPVFAASYAFGATIALIDTVVTLTRVLRSPEVAGAS